MARRWTTTLDADLISISIFEHILFCIPQEIVSEIGGVFLATANGLFFGRDLSATTGVFDAFAATNGAGLDISAQLDSGTIDFAALRTKINNEGLDVTTASYETILPFLNMLVPKGAIMNGSDGGDTFTVGTKGVWVLRGGEGDDFYGVHGGRGRILDNGTSEEDHVLFDSDVMVDLQKGFYSYLGSRAKFTIQGIEIVQIQDARGILKGDDADNTLAGGNARDKLFGRDGDDLLDGGDSNDILHGGFGSDTMRGGLGRDTFIKTARGFDGGVTDIVDFEAGEKLIIKASFRNPNSFAGIVDDVAVIGVGGTRVRLLGVDLDEFFLTADFNVAGDRAFRNVSASKNLYKGTNEDDFMAGGRTINALGGFDTIGVRDGTKVAIGGVGSDYYVRNASNAVKFVETHKAGSGDSNTIIGFQANDTLIIKGSSDSVTVIGGAGNVLVENDTARTILNGITFGDFIVNASFRVDGQNIVQSFGSRTKEVTGTALNDLIAGGRMVDAGKGDDSIIFRPEMWAAMGGAGADDFYISGAPNARDGDTFTILDFGDSDRILIWDGYDATGGPTISDYAFDGIDTTFRYLDTEVIINNYELGAENFSVFI